MALFGNTARTQNGKRPVWVVNPLTARNHRAKRRAWAASLDNAQLAEMVGICRMSIATTIYEETTRGLYQPGYLAFGAVECAVVRAEMARRTLPNRAI